MQSLDKDLTKGKGGWWRSTHLTQTSFLNVLPRRTEVPST